ALRAVEARHVAAREWNPRDALAVDVHPARAEARCRRLVDLGERGRGRIGAGVEADGVAGLAQHRTPDGAVVRVHRDTVERRVDALVFRWIDRLVGLNITLVALSVAVGVE